MFCYTKDGCEEVRGTVLFLGDSISDDGRYVSFLNAYLRLYLPAAPVALRNLGLSSETLSGLSEPDHPFPRPCVFGRLLLLLQTIRPDWVVICYGINDGIYYPLTEDYFEKYRKGYHRLIDAVHSAGAKAVVLTPPPFDPASHLAKGGILLKAGAEKYSYAEPYENYNEVMERYAAWIVDELPAYADRVIDLHSVLREDRRQLRAANPSLTVGDGIHPDLHGHWTIAKTLLKELFGFSAEGFERTMKADRFRMFDLTYARDTLLHNSDKETIGHDNANKAEYLSGAALKAALAQADTNIANYIAKHGGLRQQTGSWRGFRKQMFHFGGCEALVVEPETPARRRPWVWRTEFFGAFASADLALLRKGWHVAYLSIPDQFGAPIATTQMSAFHTFITKQFHLRKKAVLFGFSRGGLYALHYAAKESARIEALYLDAPVVNICSWPGGKGAGSGSPCDWYRCLRAFGLTEETASGYEPLLQAAVAQALAAKLPLVLVAGDSDDIVPFEENGRLLAQAWQESDAAFRLILKPGVGHHPHSLKDPSEIVAFLLAHS